MKIIRDYFQVRHRAAVDPEICLKVPNTDSLVCKHFLSSSKVIASSKRARERNRIVWIQGKDWRSRTKVLACTVFLH